MSARGQASLAEMPTPSLLKSEMHAPEEGTANERYFVDDEEDNRTPLFFKTPRGVAFELFLPGSRPGDAEA